MWMCTFSGCLRILCVWTICAFDSPLRPWISLRVESISVIFRIGHCLRQQCAIITHFWIEMGAGGISQARQRAHPSGRVDRVWGQRECGDAIFNHLAQFISRLAIAKWLTPFSNHKVLDFWLRTNCKCLFVYKQLYHVIRLNISSAQDNNSGSRI